MISSSTFINGGGGSCLYPATKGAMEGLLKGLVSEYARYNIRINGIRPAVIDTEIMRSRYSEEEWNKYIGKMPMGRAGTVLDVANLIVFLSDKVRAGFINGEIVNIDVCQDTFFALGCCGGRFQTCLYPTWREFFVRVFCMVRGLGFKGLRVIPILLGYAAPCNNA